MNNLGLNPDPPNPDRNTGLPVPSYRGTVRNTSLSFLSLLLEINGVLCAYACRKVGLWVSIHGLATVVAVFRIRM
jgi:hypothetical protein